MVCRLVVAIGDVDLDGLGLGNFLFRQGDGEDAGVEGSLDVLGIHGFGQTQTWKTWIPAFVAMTNWARLTSQLFGPLV